MRTSSLALVFVLTATSCASMHFSPSATRYGVAQSTKDAVETSDSITEEEIRNVKALVGQLPEGIRVDDSGVFRVEDPARYEILGSVKATGDGVDFLVLGFYPYVEGEEWRKGLCYWQVPLTWVTLTIWSFMSPLHYPCKVAASNSPSAIEERKERIIGSLRRTTKALGGNLVIVTALGNTKFVHVQSGETLGAVEATAGEGVAVRVK